MNHACAYVKPEETANEGTGLSAVGHFPTWIVLVPFCWHPIWMHLSPDKRKLKKIKSPGAGLLCLGAMSRVEVKRCSAFSREAMCLPLFVSYKG